MTLATPTIPVLNLFGEIGVAEAMECLREFDSGLGQLLIQDEGAVLRLPQRGRFAVLRTLSRRVRAMGRSSASIAAAVNPHARRMRLLDSGNHVEVLPERMAGPGLAVRVFDSRQAAAEWLAARAALAGSGVVR